jgi:tRNA1Val (adenine37-N6)-methyltransferase
MSEFVFQQFSLNHSKSSMKIGTDAILLGAFAEVEFSKSILEVGCGSGIISLMLAQRSLATITAIDIHSPSINEARQNFLKSQWSDRMSVIQTSLQEFSPTGTFDYIVSNPPFFSDSMKSHRDERNLARHNDTLLPGDLAKHTKRLLTKTGTFTCIIPADIIERYKEAFKAENMFPESIIHIKPKPGRESNRVIVKFSSRKNQVIESTFILRNSNNEYSDEYRRLTRDFHP